MLHACGCAGGICNTLHEILRQRPSCDQLMDQLQAQPALWSFARRLLDSVYVVEQHYRSSTVVPPNARERLRINPTSIGTIHWLIRTVEYPETAAQELLRHQFLPSDFSTHQDYEGLFRQQLEQMDREMHRSLVRESHTLGPSQVWDDGMSKAVLQAIRGYRGVLEHVNFMGFVGPIINNLVNSQQVTLRSRNQGRGS